MRAHGQPNCIALVRLIQFPATRNTPREGEDNRDQRQIDMAGGQRNSRVFGQAVRSKPGRGGGDGRSSAATRYQRQMGGGGGRNRPKNLAATDVRGNQASDEEELAARRAEYRRRRKAEGEAFDAGFGYGRYDKRALRAAAAANAAKTEPGARKEAAAAASAAAASGGGRRGWIFNMLPTVSFELVLCWRCMLVVVL